MVKQIVGQAGLGAGRAVGGSGGRTGGAGLGTAMSHVVMCCATPLTASHAPCAGLGQAGIGGGGKACVSVLTDS